MPRIQGLAESGLLTGNKLIKDAAGYVFSITIAWQGATAGNRVYLRDGNTATADIEVTFVFPTTDGTITKEWTQGKHFATGIFYDEGATPNVFAELTYR